MQILSEREPALSDHTREVAGYAVAVGRALGLENEALDEIARAAELHDVGKVAVPDRVLYGTDELSESDWKLLRAAPGRRRAHPRLASGAAAGRADRPLDARALAGGRLPGRPGRDATSRSARASSPSATPTTRCSPRARTGRRRSPAAALAELRADAGTQFDPAVVAAFVVVMTTSSGAPAPRAVRRRPVAA